MAEKKGEDGTVDMNWYGSATEDEDTGGGINVDEVGWGGSAFEAGRDENDENDGKKKGLKDNATADWVVGEGFNCDVALRFLFPLLFFTESYCSLHLE